MTGTLGVGLRSIRVSEESGWCFSPFFLQSIKSLLYVQQYACIVHLIFSNIIVFILPITHPEVEKAGFKSRSVWFHSLYSSPLSSTLLHTFHMQRHRQGTDVKFSLTCPSPIFMLFAFVDHFGNSSKSTCSVLLPPLIPHVPNLSQGENPTFFSATIHLCTQLKSEALAHHHWWRRCVFLGQQWMPADLPFIYAGLDWNPANQSFFNLLPGPLTPNSCVVWPHFPSLLRVCLLCRRESKTMNIIHSASHHSATE
jgi:hypothetical protein